MDRKQRAEDDDYATIKRAWTNELGAPELLPYCHDAVSNLLELIQHQQAIQNTAKQSQHAFISLCYELECMRYQYVLRSYLEVRLEKIERLAYYLDLEVKEEWKQHLLSLQEREFLDRLIEAMNQYYASSTLQHMPSYLVQCDERRIVDPDMIQAPCLKDQVCCMVRETVGPIDLNPSGQGTGTTIGIDTLALQQGDIYRVPYEAVRSLVYQDKVCLL